MPLSLLPTAATRAVIYPVLEVTPLRVGLTKITTVYVAAANQAEAIARWRADHEALALLANKAGQSLPEAYIMSEYDIATAMTDAGVREHLEAAVPSAVTDREFEQWLNWQVQGKQAHWVRIPGTGPVVGAPAEAEAAGAAA